MKFSLLLDTYGVLLTDRKREILEYYYDEDYSLSEISELTGISRQGVRDSIKKSEEEIYALEARLHLAEKNEALIRVLRSVQNDMNALEERLPQVDTDIGNRLKSITEKLAGLLLTAESGPQTG